MYAHQRAIHLVICTLLATSLPVMAADWSDTSIGIKYGTNWSEPGIAAPIHKTLYQLVHISGDKLGTNLLVGEVYASDSKDPAAGGGEGAQEFFGFYKRTFSLSKLSGREFAFGPVKDVSLAARFDRDTKNIAFAPSARKVMAGLTFDLAVPVGWTSVTAYAYNERNYNGIVGQTVNFDTTYRVDLNWGIPFRAGLPMSWNGGLAYTGKKGKDGFGNETLPETRLYTEVLVDLGKGFKAGLAYEWWTNKYGANPALVPGTRHSTPQLVAEYHF